VQVVHNYVEVTPNVPLGQTVTQRPSALINLELLQTQSCVTELKENPLKQETHVF
jgi:hypothetical protein